MAIEKVIQATVFILRADDLEMAIKKQRANNLRAVNLNGGEEWVWEDGEGRREDGGSLCHTLRPALSLHAEKKTNLR